MGDYYWEQLVPSHNPTPILPEIIPWEVTDFLLRQLLYATLLLENQNIRDYSDFPLASRFADIKISGALPTIKFSDFNSFLSAPHPCDEAEITQLLISAKWLKSEIMDYLHQKAISLMKYNTVWKNFSQ